MKSVYTFPASSCCAVTGVAGSLSPKDRFLGVLQPLLSSPEEKTGICLLQLQMQLNYSTKPVLGTTVRGELLKDHEHDTHGRTRVVFRAGHGEVWVRFCGCGTPLL